ncbi:MAG: WD40 repeat domain-containing protein [Pseudodesulfovibrio sp.]|nr:WD40 repeat domain-containing protein [Pseudodesulfovibrio sp.]
MGRISTWDWEIGEKIVVKSLSPLQDHGWQEEPHVSPDGETLAAVVNLAAMEFSVRTNDSVWDVTYERIWYPRFSPDGRMTAIGQQDGESALLVDAEQMGETYEYAWETKFSDDGSTIAIMMKNEGLYGVALNGTPWENLFENANNYVLSSDGKHSSAIVQTVSMGQAEIEVFAKGIHSLAVDGNAFPGKYLNLWTPVFDSEFKRVAAQARVSMLDYTITVDDKPWSTVYGQVWEPIFHPLGEYVAAPVRDKGKWGVASDGAPLWEPRYAQCTQLQFSPKGDRLWAIVAPAYGKFTVACNNIPWSTLSPAVTDIVLNPEGDRAGVIMSNNNRDFKIVVDDKAWEGTWDMVWPVAFAPKGLNVAAVVEKNGKQQVLMNGKPFGREFDRIWEPVFNEDGTKVMIRAIENNSYVRIVANVTS